MLLRTPAKVNLTLEVLGRRADGYHEIVTVLQAVDLWDRLSLEEAPTLSLSTDDAAVPAGEANLVLRAARALQEAAGTQRGARIHLAKRIPMAAGLGGGSSDAAATLVGLARLWGLRWGRARLAPVAVGLGMDVAFFLGRGRALGAGRGEKLTPLPGGGGHALVLVTPDFPLVTSEVYGRVAPGWRSAGLGAPRMVEALRRRSAAGVAAALVNDLEAAVEPMAAREIQRIKAALLAEGALGAVMSGSGPTVFGLARSLDQARRIRRRLTRSRWAAWAVRTISTSCIRVERAA